MARDQHEPDATSGRGGNGAVRPRPRELCGNGSDMVDPDKNGRLAREVPHGQPATVPPGGDNPTVNPLPITSLEGLFTGGFVAPLDDRLAGERWPTLQLCMRAVLTKDGDPRAGGEVKTVASGPNYVTTLTMPEEGRMVRVAHDGLSNAWDALEALLRAFPIPWVQCSDFARRRAKHKPAKEKKKLLDPSERSR